MTGTYSSDREHFKSLFHLDGDTALPANVNHFQSPIFLSMLGSISIYHFSTFWQDPTDAAAMF